MLSSFIFSMSPETNKQVITTQGFNDHVIAHLGWSAKLIRPICGYVYGNKVQHSRAEGWLNLRFKTASLKQHTHTHTLAAHRLSRFNQRGCQLIMEASVKLRPHQLRAPHNSFPLRLLQQRWCWV